MLKLVTSIFFMALSASALAVDPGNTVPEPGSLWLVAVAGAAVGARYLARKKRK